MKSLPIHRCLAACAGLIGLTSLVPLANAETVYFDDFTTPGIDRGGSYTSSIVGATTTTGSGVWRDTTIEAGGWGQTGDGRATPTSSNFLPITPDSGRIYTVQATIDTTGAAGQGSSWFTLGFTSTLHHWNGNDASTIDTDHLVRFNDATVSTITYTKTGADLIAGGIQYVGWITDNPGVVNLNPSNEQVKITNFRLISGVANPTVTYDGNGSDGGTVPTDGSSPYTHSATVTVLGDGTMTRTGFNFIGWNTAADGSGTNYSPAATFTIYDNTTLYAKWLPSTLVTLTYDGNGSTGGSAPTDPSSPYTSGATVTVLGNTGLLTKNSYTFNGWNTAANGSGTSYNPAATFTINANTTLFAQWTPGPDYVWNNSATTGNWNTSDANWSGATWSNSATNNAFFTSVGGSVILDPGITAGAVNVGNTGINFAGVSLIDGDLSASSLTVQGSSSNGANYGSNPTLNVNSAVTVSGDAAVGRSNLAITGGTFTANRIISAPASADWARLVVSGGTVTATNGVDGSVYTGATFAIDLNGGELLAPSIRVADREASGFAWLTFNGGTLKAIGADNADFITTYGGGQTTFVDNGGAIIDTNGRNIGLTVNMVRSGSSTGGLTKDGLGTLTLAGAVYNYRGNTLINEGALNVSSGSAMEFFPTTIGNTNSVSAGSTTATLSFLGQVYLDLSAADATGGNTWNLFNVGSFTPPPVITPNLVNSTLGVFTEGPSGTWELPVTGAKWVFTEADGNLAYVVTATDYDNWKTANGVTGGENDDDDSDGLTNHEEYAFGLDPTGGSEVNPITVPLDKTTGIFSYTRRQQSLTGLNYTVWYSTDLATWNEDTTALQGIPTLAGQVETVPVTLTNSLLSNSKLFIQVRAQ